MSPEQQADTRGPVDTPAQPFWGEGVEFADPKVVHEATAHDAARWQRLIEQLVRSKNKKKCH